MTPTLKPSTSAFHTGRVSFLRFQNKGKTVIIGLLFQNIKIGGTLMSGVPSAAEGINQPIFLQERAVMGFWGVAMCLMVMNTTMFNVALPTVIHDFQLTSSVASWIVSGYSIIFALSAITYSRLSDYLPIRRLISIGLFIMGFSSVIGFFAENFYMLLTARLLQAIGASAIPGLAMVLASKYIPLTRRGKAMSVISSSAAIGFGMGPIIGGILTEHLGWNYLFLAPFFVLIIIPFVRRYLPMEPVHPVHFDYIGAILLGVGVVSLLLFVTSGNYIALSLVIPCLVLFWRHIHGISKPFIQPVLLHDRDFLKLVVMPFTAFFINFATVFTIPIMLVQLYNKSPFEIGLIIFPGAICSAFAANWIGKMIDRRGPVLAMRIALVLLISASILFALFSDFSPYAILFIFMISIVGSNCLTASANNEVSRILSKELLGAGMGLSQLFQFFGGAFGVGITGMLIAAQQSLPAAENFRNIFLVLMCWLLIVQVILQLYLRNKEKNAVSGHSNDMNI
jgi:DHA2 family metal-tetracycline-proton antiporter-like MFS transporter